MQDLIARITIRPAAEQDLPQVRKLFRDTILSVNRKDYSDVQVTVWSSRHEDGEWWMDRLKTQYLLIAEIDGQIAGFCSLTPEGYLDLLYVNKDYQGQGVATILLEEIEAYAEANAVRILRSDVSITARPFFEKQGFKVVTQQLKKVKGTEFTNFLMEKELR